MSKQSETVRIMNEIRLKIMTLSETKVNGLWKIRTGLNQEKSNRLSGCAVQR